MTSRVTQSAKPVTPNRVVAVLTVLMGVGGAVAPVLANMDWQSTAGVIAGVGAATTAAVTWLLGWQKHESRTAAENFQREFAKTR